MSHAGPASAWMLHTQIDPPAALVEEVRMDLNPEQQRALDAVLDGKSIVLAGPAGSGKSHWIKALKTLRPDAVVTATTGLAATAVGGVTIHKFAGIGIADPGPAATTTDSDVDYVAKAVAHINRKIRPDIRRSVRQAQLLVIEECSMLSEYLFNLLDLLFRRMRRVERPWGGIQLVLVGDMRQLAPVAKRRDHALVGRFFFESPQFTRTFTGGVHVLNQIFRQQSGVLRDLLGRVAVGKPSAADIELLEDRVIRTPDRMPPGTATWLYGKKDTVGCYNAGHLASIDKPPHTYKMTITKTEGATDGTADWAIKNCIAEKHLTVKEGAYVMLLWNMEPGFANGTVGYVVGYTPDGFPLFQKKEAYLKEDRKSMHEVIAVKPVQWEVVDHAYGTVRMNQVPMKLAYALTIHKAQGIQVDEGALAIDEENCFVPGQAYVALSRLTSIDGMYLSRFEPSAIRASPAAIAFYEKYGGSATETASELFGEPPAPDGPPPPYSLDGWLSPAGTR
jgi:ATP-dependent DNA helicase PIF1